MSPEKRKPASFKTGSLEISKSLAAIDTSDNTEALTNFQALRIRQRFPVSMSVAIATARLAYANGGAA
ncbi:hypothetical protein CK218_27790 [Mesorhizobium sp. WSM3879]|uniref:hypothetical protein n=1 Tax=Mesorhizobium sp. WSM3879 TaxID=2029406 RepID=UPI000BAFE758|nr:hypothetical protein [Mesorhizobium sp. WSM3879]PBB77908.1 hypothetical protein CK218_27790 [Mesorhizobium sp. WSM3879]